MKYYEEFILKEENIVLQNTLHTYIDCIFLNDDVINFDFKNKRIHGHSKKEYDAYYQTECNLIIKIEYESIQEKHFEMHITRQDIYTITYKRYEISKDKVYVYGFVDNTLYDGILDTYESIHSFPAGRYYTRYKTLLSLNIPKDKYEKQAQYILDDIQKYVEYTQEYYDSIYYIDIFPYVLFTPGNKHYAYLLNAILDLIKYTRQNVSTIYFYSLKHCLDVIKVEFKDGKYDMYRIMV